MFSKIIARQAVAGAILLGAVVAVGCLGVVRAQMEPQTTEGARYICRGLKFLRECVYIQIGYGTSWGLRVDSDHNGIYSDVVNGTGLHATSLTGAAVQAESSSYDKPVLAAIAHNASTNLFKAQNTKTGTKCLIDPNANLTCSGKIMGGMAMTLHRSGEGEQVLAYGSESATATIEDVGTARMTDGVANVRIDPAFASVTDRKWYYVFLTPLGETRGLYVSAKTASAFQVRENERGRSNVMFDYRIVAHPQSADDRRLPIAQ